MSINSKSFNQLILVGRLGRDAEVAQTKNGYPYVKLALATADLVKNASGNYEEHTIWHQIVYFGERAQKMSSLLKKGTQILVRASLDYRDIEADGKKYRLPDIKVDEVVLLSSAARTSESSPQGNQAKAPARAAQPQAASQDELMC